MRTQSRLRALLLTVFFVFANLYWRAASTGFHATKESGTIFYENKNLGGSPMLIESMKGTMSISVDTSGLSVSAIDARDGIIAAVPSRATNGTLTFDVGSHGTMYYSIKKRIGEAA